MEDGRLCGNDGAAFVLKPPAPPPPLPPAGEPGVKLPPPPPPTTKKSILFPKLPAVVTSKVPDDVKTCAL